MGRDSSWESSCVGTGTERTGWSAVLTVSAGRCGGDRRGAGLLAAGVALTGGARSVACMGSSKPDSCQAAGAGHSNKR